jgi:hypothetical protein
MAQLVARTRDIENRCLELELRYGKIAFPNGIIKSDDDYSALHIADEPIPKPLQQLVRAAVENKFDTITENPT